MRHIFRRDDPKHSEERKLTRKREGSSAKKSLSSAKKSGLNGKKGYEKKPKKESKNGSEKPRSKSRGGPKQNLKVKAVKSYRDEETSSRKSS